MKKYLSLLKINYPAGKNQSEIRCEREEGLRDEGQGATAASRKRNSGSSSSLKTSSLIHRVTLHWRHYHQKIMKVTHVFVFAVLIMLQDSMAQESQMVGLPMQGHTTATTTNILVLGKNTNQLWVKYWQKNSQDTLTKSFQSTAIDTLKRFELSYFKFQLEGLEANSDYMAYFYFEKIKPRFDGLLELKTTPQVGEVTDFSFHLGSCAAPFKDWLVAFKPYNKIFDRMEADTSDFMVWMGDNVYYLTKEWNSKEKMIKKNLQYRQNKKINTYLNSRPQYATWDDHDFGPNNAHGDFKNKGESLALFKKFWANGSWGLENAPGVFGKFSYSDADFFMLDSRYNRVKDKTMFGEAQMNWLKSELKKSTATFKFIVSGTQIIPHVTHEDFGDYPVEKEDLMTFLKNEEIKGAIFLSGDTHYAEFMKQDRENTYPLYEMTASALTSPYFPGSAADHPYRFGNSLYTNRNFGKISITGEEGNRSVTFELYNNKGGLVWSYRVKGEGLR